MILATPIFILLRSKLGYDPIWFGIMIGITPNDRLHHPTGRHLCLCCKKRYRLCLNTIYRGVLAFSFEPFLVQHFSYSCFLKSQLFCLISSWVNKCPDSLGCMSESLRPSAKFASIRHVSRIRSSHGRGVTVRDCAGQSSYAPERSALNFGCAFNRVLFTRPLNLHHTAFRLPRPLL